MSISGNTSATNAGTYTAIFTLNSGYTWQDGTTTAKSVTWSIQRAAAAINVHNPQSLKIPPNSEVSLAFTVVGTGDISAISADTDTATVSINFLQKIITVSALSNGTTSITLSLPQSTNYDATSVTINVRVSRVSDIYTISLLKGEESALTDDCSLEWAEANHNEYPVAISTTTSKFGNSSLYFNKKGESIHSLCTLGGQDFTVDWWAYLGTPSGSASDGQRSIAGVYNSEAEFFSFLFTGSNQIYFRILQSGGIGNRTGISVSLDVWHHFAVVYSHTAGKVYLFVDGTLKVTRTGTLARYTDMIAYIGGGDPNYTAAYPYPNTYVDNYRISDGIARWTANFTPPNENEY